MERLLLVALFAGVGFAGCGRAADFSGPAPAGSMQCALDHGLAAGYELVEGGVERDFLRLVQRLPRPPGEERVAQPQPDLGDVVLRESEPRPVENQLVVRRERGRLSITVLGLNDAGVRVGAGSNAEDQARSIFALCTTDPPTAPAADERFTPPRQGNDAS